MIEAASKVKPSAPVRDRRQTIDVVIETPRGSRNKFKYDQKRRIFKLKSVLPVGATFPYDFGFVPETKAEDGDPIDVLVLMDEPTFTGCLVPSRLIGVIEAEQTEDGAAMRNDRLIAVAQETNAHRDIHTLRALDKRLIDEIGHFFVSYNEARHKRFTIKRIRGSRAARRLLEKAQRRGT